MFTGIVQGQGLVVSTRPNGSGIELEISAPGLINGSKVGESISVNGVCLTVAAPPTVNFVADVMPETMRHTALGMLQVGDAVNLELAMRADSRFGGHFVQGHVDGVARLLARNSDENWDVLRFELPNEIAKYVALKGSITVQGVSLTVSAIGDGWFEVSLIPTTLRETTLGELQVGDVVNLEVDVLARQLERLIQERNV